MLLYNLDPDYEKKLPENQFLAKYNFVDQDLHLVDDKGRRVDSEGRLVNKDGRYINEAGELIDIKGNRVDLEGDYVVDFSPFLDDEGKAIEEKTELNKSVPVPETPVSPVPNPIVEEVKV